MGSGIYIAASGANAQNKALEVTANNIANASTPGFKAQRTVFSSVLTAAQQQAQTEDMAYTSVADTATDTSAGQYRQTGNPLDLALQGDGYFAITTPNGVRYTRAGNFRVDAEGKIVNNAGQAARAVGGGEISIPPEAGSITVDREGAVYADGAEVGRLEIAKFAGNSLKREGGNLFEAVGQPIEDGDKATVESGVLEGSNFNAVRGVVDLVRISRTYQALMSMIESYKSIDSRTARSLGGPK